ncbi:MAG TPA: CocE/NonD family hydrolase [Streptosporangiaceae bacterium]|nr:CocE/NonD family hydrolase [Streptosporangiaceae bacterium]
MARAARRLIPDLAGGTSMTVMSRFFERAMRLPPPLTRDVDVQRDLRVPMPDGVTLLADRYVPAAAASAQLPLILVRCPYGRRGPFGMLSGRLFAERGFQSVVQSCRGTFGSGGELDPLGVTEAADGLATVEWLRKQPWYPGSFGTWGPSYLGITQWALATLGLPDHKAMAVQVSSTRPRDLIQPNGSFSLETMLEWIDQVARQERTGAMFRQQLRARKLRELAGQLPLGDLDRLATGATVPYWQSWLTEDAEFWDQHQFAAGPGRLTATVAMTAGWYDFFLPAQLRDFARLRAAGQQPRLTIGPWRHTDNEAAATWVRDGLDFLQAQLNSAASLDATGTAPRVRIFVTGAEQWRDLPDWPPPSSPQTWYLQPDGGLGPVLPAASEPDRYTYNPADPTPSLAGPVGNSGRARVDNRVLEARPDVLTYTSAPLAADTEVMGVPVVTLHVSSSREHTDFFARVCEVDPAGQSLNVCDALLRLSPGQPAVAADGTRLAQFELWPVAHRFAAGNRLRLQVSSGAHPRYARNPGTADPLATATLLVTQDQRVYHDPEHPSALTLPLVTDTR